MLGLNLKTLLPALIFSLCILEMSFGLYIRFNLVWWFYLYFIWSLFHVFAKSGVNFSAIKVNSKLLFLYFLSCIIYIYRHLLEMEFYKHSTNESFNILWWSIFGVLLLVQIKESTVNRELFFNYVKQIVFFGCLIASILGILKYINILAGNFVDSYFYEGVLMTGSSLSPDYNVFSLGLSIGVLLSIGTVREISKKYSKVLYISAVILILISILLSGSRRGILMSAYIIVCLGNANSIMNARKQTTLIFILIIPITVLILVNNYWNNISEYLTSTDILDQSIARILTLKEEFYGENERTVRFSWSIDYYFERSRLEQIFGSGFRYLKLMGANISGDIEDNPHNYLLSALLYGGFLCFIIMVSLTLELIYSSFYHNRRWYPVVLLVIFFGVTSSNSLFAMRMFPTMVIIISAYTNQEPSKGIYFDKSGEVTS